MSTIYKMHYLKTHLSSLVEKVDLGESLVFGVGGQPQYVITKYRAPKGKRGGLGMFKSEAKGSVEPDLGGWTDSEIEEFNKHDPLLPA